MEHNYIFTDRCDTCGRPGPCVLHHDGNAVPVLSSCRVCDPLSFERVARRDIDAWLSGGSDRAFGRSQR